MTTKNTTTTITDNEDTIVAVATPPGAGSIGVVRISGTHAFSIADRLVFNRPAKIGYRVVVHPQTRENLDDGYVLSFQAPHSFTGEDVVELQVHGNPWVLDRIVSACVDLGARLAMPGEFSRRAFINGKIDLLQAEAIAELIHSQSQEEAKTARQRLDGQLSTLVTQFHEDVTDCLAMIEAQIDFPEEGIEFPVLDQIQTRLDALLEKVEHLLSTYERNQTLHNGFRVVLVGQPNVGKSSLFNSLLQDDRAIVTPIAGTTRDVLSEEIFISGNKVKILDTAGLRKDLSDIVEEAGVVKSGQEIKRAHLVWWIRSAQGEQDEMLLDALGDVSAKNCWSVWNKMDLVQNPPESGAEQKKVFEQEFFVSAKTGQGIKSLIDALTERVVGESQQITAGGISNHRQRGLLTQCQSHLKTAKTLLARQEPPELISSELRRGYQKLNRLLGYDEDMEGVLDQIFSRFCIGK